MSRDTRVFQLTYIGNARVGEVWIDGFAVNAARMCPFTRAPGWKPLFPVVPRFHHSRAASGELQRGESTYWWCSVRPKEDRCKATIIQKGNNFLPGHQLHNHPAKTGSHIAAVITRDVKKQAKANIFRAARTIVEEIMVENCDLKRARGQ
uniref:FLYWCH-type domain-containing protein n=1 Tax=Magallana gigas TaxID=29159 RepID=K1QFE7_MAGGI